MGRGPGWAPGVHSSWREAPKGRVACAGPALASPRARTPGGRALRRPAGCSQNASQKDGPTFSLHSTTHHVSRVDPKRARRAREQCQRAAPESENHTRKPADKRAHAHGKTEHVPNWHAMQTCPGVYGQLSSVWADARGSQGRCGDGEATEREEDVDVWPGVRRALFRLQARHRRSAPPSSRQVTTGSPPAPPTPAPGRHIH
jgi:hypothetical protein